MATSPPIFSTGSRRRSLAGEGGVLKQLGRQGHSDASGRNACSRGRACGSGGRRAGGCARRSQQRLLPPPATSGQQRRCQDAGSCRGSNWRQRRSAGQPSRRFAPPRPVKIGAVIRASVANLHRRHHICVAPLEAIGADRGIDDPIAPHFGVTRRGFRTRPPTGHRTIMISRRLLLSGFATLALTAQSHAGFFGFKTKAEREAEAAADAADLKALQEEACGWPRSAARNCPQTIWRGLMR